jgi:hypothetical protein
LICLILESLVGGFGLAGDSGIIVVVVGGSGIVIVVGGSVIVIGFGITIDLVVVDRNFVVIVLINYCTYFFI